MTRPEIEDAVLCILSSRRGRESAITGQRMAERLSLKDDRPVPFAIRELLKKGWAIAAATDPPPGYFIVETWAEKAEYEAGLKGRLIEDAKRRRDFKVAAGRMLEGTAQGRLI